MYDVRNNESEVRKRLNMAENKVYEKKNIFTKQYNVK